MSIQTIREAKRAADEAEAAATGLVNFLLDVEGLVDAAADLLSGAQEIEHEGESGFFVSAGAIEDLRRTFGAVE